MSSFMSGPPCVDCARVIIQSGIMRVVGKIGDDDPSKWNECWRESMLVSMEMFHETGIGFMTIELVEIILDRLPFAVNIPK